MTLALYGKSRRRQGGLALAALLAVFVAFAGAIVLQGSRGAHAINETAVFPTSPAELSADDGTVLSIDDDADDVIITFPLSVPAGQTVLSVTLTIEGNETNDAIGTQFEESDGTNLTSDDFSWSLSAGFEVKSYTSNENDALRQYVQSAAGSASIVFKLDPSASGDADIDVDYVTLKVVTAAPASAGPEITGQCSAADIHLLVDNSGSIGSGNASSMETAIEDFTQAIEGALPDSNYRVSTFAGGSFSGGTWTAAAPADGSLSFGSSGLTPTALALANAGSTNPGLTVDNPNNILIVVTDGSPNVTYPGGASPRYYEGAQDAIEQAEIARGANWATAVVAIGTGDPGGPGAPYPANVNQGIAGVDAAGPTGNVFPSNFGTLAADLEALLTTDCVREGQITIEKIAGADLNKDFTFTVSPASGIPSPNPFVLSDQETKNWSSQAGSYTVTETEPGGWELLNIACWNHGQDPNSGDVDIQTANNYVTVNLEDGDDIHCTFTNRPTSITINAHKIVCPSEALLPDAADSTGSSGVSRPIGPGTAAAFIAANPTCSYATGWGFEYQWGGSNPGNNSDGTALADFDTTTAGSTPATLTLPIQQGQTLWVREQKPAAYINFSNGGSTTPQVSAEMYCSADVLNYDNWERIENTNGQSDLTPGATYWCVGFNVEKDGWINVTKRVTNVDSDPTEFDFSWPNPATAFTLADDGNSGNVPIAAGPQVVTEAPEPGYTTLGWARVFPPAQCPAEMPQAPGGSVHSVGFDNTYEVDVEGNITYVICFYNEIDRGRIWNVKIVDNVVDDTTDFTAEIEQTDGDNDYTSSLFSESGGPSFDYAVPGTYTATENVPAGYQHVITYPGFMVGDAPQCEGIGEPTGDTLKIEQTSAEQTLEAGGDIVFCHENVAVGTVVLIKNETVQSAGAQNWNFNATVLSDPALTTAANNTQPPAQTSDSDTFNNVPVGNYTISEVEGADQCVAGSTSANYQTNAKAQAGSIPNPDPVADKVGGSAINYTVQKGQTTYIVFENQGCGTVLSAANIIVRKFATDDASMTTPGDDSLVSGWTITITGTGGAATGFGPVSQQTIGGVAAFNGVPDGTYTISETLQGGWTVVGSNSSNDGLGQVAGTVRAGVTVGLDQTRNIDFFNREPAGIIVIKTVDDQVGSRGVSGWQINVAGCGTSINKQTDGAGQAVFSNLQPADNCAYTVTETDTEGFSVSYTPGQVVAPGPGETATVNVKNTRLPGPTPTPPTPTATATPTEEPEPTETVAGEKTPGPTEEPPETPTKEPGLISTPIAPETGTGYSGGGTAGSIGLALLGLAAVTGGMTLMAFGRRKAS